MGDNRVATRATLWVIVASSTMTVMAGAILGPVVGAIQAGLGVSESLAGLIITTHAAFIVLASPIVGSIVDRFGPRRPYIAGLFLYAIGGGAGLLVDAFVPLLFTRAVLGVGVAFVYTGVSVLIYDLYEGEQMDRVLGLRSGANSFGGAVWPLVGGALGALFWQFPFAVYLVAFPLGIVAFVVIPPTSRKGEDGASGTNAGEASDDGGLSELLSVLRRQPALVSVYALYFGANVLVYAVVVFYPQLLADIGVSSSASIGPYLAAQGAAGGVSGAMYSRLRRWADRRQLVLAAFVLWVLAFGLATRVDGPVAAVPPVVLFGLGLGLVFPSTFRWIELFVPEHKQGQFSSYLASVGYIGQFLSPILFGGVVGRLGVRGVFGVAATAVAAGLFGLVAVIAVRR